MSDESALEQYLLTQNVNYFNLLYDRYSNKVFAKCISMLKDNDIAEDATQEIFVKVLLSLSKFNGKSKFSTWLYSITYNFCIDIIRKGKKDIITPLDDNTYLDIEDNIDDSEILETNVFRLKEILEKMNIDDKSILMMKYQDDLSIKEICDVMDKTESAIKMKILRAKERFLKIYQENYGKSG
ncbi:MAG: RNA polymerase sigma factor [Saprospiraceae bacterium]|jgi:RNA polymerase sigma factor (sigma-70 family)|nr:RNA polymerase sigma factor [Saprospiraceae bacterium]